MSGSLTIVLILLVFIIVYQIAKASEYATILRDEAKVNAQTNRLMAWLLVAFFVFGVWGIWECHQALKGRLLPPSASVEGVEYDAMFEMTMWVTGIVFLATQAVLFWFAYRYQSTEKRTAFFYPHNNKLELIWTTIPAIAMAVLVAIGLKYWFKVTDEAPKGHATVEIVGKQFNWLIRYPGKDGVLGARDFRKINDANNVLGLDWDDTKNMDDIVAQNGEMHLVVGRPVKLIIGSRDVIHDVGLTHFRMKMDAVPGIVTTMWFTPRYTTKQMQEITKDPDFVYEISCDQMCGKGHYSMRGTIIVETQAEYDKWLASQKSYYAESNPSAAPAAPATEPAADSANTVAKNN
ncbi:MAG TPA: cytochrome c oxidase subunit II [Flavipsychrobacter sp.]|nr:cytochrome c oxidase subunit II [Flavipsychrobacter sp.]